MISWLSQGYTLISPQALLMSLNNALLIHLGRVLLPKGHSIRLCSKPRQTLMEEGMDLLQSCSSGS